MYTDWIGWRGRRGDELPAAGGAARFKPDQGVEARPLRATNAITNRKLEMVSSVLELRAVSSDMPH